MQKFKIFLLSLLILPAMMLVGCGEHKHELKVIGEIDATCTTAGNIKYYTCDGCGLYFSDEEATTIIAEDSWIIPAGHNLTHVTANSATCTTNGNTSYYVCDSCDTYFSDESATQTILENSWVIPATHTDANEDNMCEVCGNGKKFVANSVNYATLEEAFANAVNNSTITLYEDVELTECIALTDRKITLNMNGKTITFPNDTVGDGLFLVTGTAELVIDGNGSLNSASLLNDYSMCLWAKDGGKIIVNSGTFTNVGAKDIDDNQVYNNNELIYAGANGTIIINGGTFIGNTENSTVGAKFTLNLKDNTNAKIIVNGGEFVGFNPAEAMTEPTAQSNTVNGAYSFLAEGYTVEVVENTYIVIEA